MPDPGVERRVDEPASGRHVPTPPVPGGEVHDDVDAGHRVGHTHPGGQVGHHMPPAAHDPHVFPGERSHDGTAQGAGSPGHEYSHAVGTGELPDL